MLDIGRFSLRSLRMVRDPGSGRVRRDPVGPNSSKIQLACRSSLSSNLRGAFLSSSPTFQLFQSTPGKWRECTSWWTTPHGLYILNTVDPPMSVFPRSLPRHVDLDCFFVFFNVSGRWISYVEKLPVENGTVRDRPRLFLHEGRSRAPLILLPLSAGDPHRSPLFSFTNRTRLRTGTTPCGSLQLMKLVPRRFFRRDTCH